MIKIYISIFCIALSAGLHAEDGLNLEKAFFKLNNEVNDLNDEILSLKEENTLLREGQRLNIEKINELFEIIKLKSLDENIKKTSLKNSNEQQALKLYSNGRNAFVAGEYNKSIELLNNYIELFPNSFDVENSKLWLGRAYFANNLYLKSKSAYLDFQSNEGIPPNQEHPKYADSLYELSKVLVELKEINEAKLLLSKIIKDYPKHPLVSKASQLLEDL